MNIKNCRVKNLEIPSYRDYSQSRNEVSFGSQPPIYKFKNAGLLKKALPGAAFLCSVGTVLGYAVGSAGLFYDSYNKNNKSLKKNVCKKNEAKRL